MEINILDGKGTAASIEQEITNEVNKIVDSGKRRPNLVAILVGEDGASQTYVGHKERTCKAVGFDSTVIRLQESISEEALLEEIAKINGDSSVDGLIVQLPLPKHIAEQRVIEAIDPVKDVDGFHPVNIGKMVLALPAYLPATPAGIMELLKRYNIETDGKECVIIGRSNIVGKPLANLLLQKSTPGNSTVTVCHSRTKNLKEIVKRGDIVIAALGVPNFLKGDMVKSGAVVIDVGITRVEAPTKSGFKLVGDVDWEEVAPKASYITPVPGGVGPMTIVSLLSNTLKAYLAQHNSH
ncbi:MAG: tetrahydrofolate dehydrogenase/cyclohydrolase catalytic domain-containing protein [Bacteroidales bacterium]